MACAPIILFQKHVIVSVRIDNKKISYFLSHIFIGPIFISATLNFCEVDVSFLQNILYRTSFNLCT